MLLASAEQLLLMEPEAAEEPERLEVPAAELEAAPDLAPRAMSVVSVAVIRTAAPLLLVPLVIVARAPTESVVSAVSLASPV